MGRRTMLVDGFGRRRYHATTWAVAVRTAAVAEEEKEEDSPLESKLRRLALLNGGEGVNPRSRHQVSKLLYPEDDVGPTDKATLQRIMMGGDKSTMDLVKSTQKGILVTRTWYIRMVDPQTVLLTGLTRDGTFYIENGEIKYPIKNFRFNESPVIMLNNIEELGKPVRVGDDESPFVMMIPPMKIKDFTFTSLSDAV